MSQSDSLAMHLDPVPYVQSFFMLKVLTLFKPDMES